MLDKMLSMREEEEPSWFARWEEQLPTPDELTPLSQTLITPDLALAFDIPTSPSPAANPSVLHHPHHDPASLLHGGGHGLSAAAAAAAASSQAPAECDAAAAGAAGSDLNGGGGGGGGVGGGGGGAGEEPARTLKRPRLVWTPQLHKRFVDAVAHLGIKNAVPKTIMQLMSVDGLTRENVASHLQKYRLYLKRMQGLTSSSSSSSASAAAAHGGGGGGAATGDPATDHLFATGPVPPHFLAPPRSAAAAPDPYIPFVPAVAATLQHHQQLTAMQQQHQQQQQQFYHHQRHLGPYGASPPVPANGAAAFEHGFLSRAVPLPGMHRMAGFVPQPQPLQPPPYADDLDSGARGGSGGRRELTLFPTEAIRGGELLRCDKFRI